MAIRNCEPARTCTFKRGDKVRCKWAKNSDGLLTVGNVYTIQAGNSEGNSVSVEGIEGAFDYSRFELVKPSTKPSKIKAGRIARLENIEWINTAIRLPDDDQIVLVYSEHESEPVWPGYVTDGVWHSANGFMKSSPSFWADMPVGPKGGA